MYDICDRFGVSATTAALQYAARVPQVVNVTVGAAEPAQLDATVVAMATPIDPALWAALAGARRS